MGCQTFSALAAVDVVGAGVCTEAAWAEALWMSNKRMRTSVGVAAGHSVSHSGSGHLMVAMTVVIHNCDMMNKWGHSLSLTLGLVKSLLHQFGNVNQNTRHQCVLKQMRRKGKTNELLLATKGGYDTQ